MGRNGFLEAVSLAKEVPHNHKIRPPKFVKILAVMLHVANHAKLGHFAMSNFDDISEIRI